MTDGYKHLGRSIRDDLEHFPEEPGIVAGARHKFVTRLDTSSNGMARWGVGQHRWWIVGAACATLAVAVGLGTRLDVFEDSRPISVQLETREGALLGRWVAAEQETKQLRFSDGTRLSLHPETRVLVEETRKDGATIRLGTGRTLARVIHQKDATWRFVAGPYTVRVTGTEFDLSWQPGGGVLELALHEGAVEISGPSLEQPRKVTKGEFVRVVAGADVGRGVPSDAAPEEVVTSERAQNETGKTKAASPRQGEDGLSHDRDAPAHASAGDAASKRRSSDAPKQSDWHDLLAEGQEQEALHLVLSTGTASALARASADELWALARAARVGGHPKLARDTLISLRTRYGSRGRTAYLLGKVHADQLHANSQAISWFETYLKEAPSGPLSEQALGRLVELQAGGSREKEAAARYLERFPKGSYAKFARSLLD